MTADYCILLFEGWGLDGCDDFIVKGQTNSIALPKTLPRLTVWFSQVIWQV